MFDQIKTDKINLIVAVSTVDVDSVGKGTLNTPSTLNMAPKINLMISYNFLDHSAFLFMA